MNVRAVLRECAVDLLDTEPSVTVEQVVGCAYRRHGDVFASEAERMVLAAAKTIVADLMRHLTDDEEDQLVLPLAGLALPSAIAVQTPNGTYYVRSDKATWPELLAGRDVRVRNVAAAQSKLDAYDESIETLRPIMEADASITVALALLEMRAAA